MNIDGREIAKQLNEQTKLRIEKLSFKPLLVDIVVGDDPASLSYVRIKQKKALEVGLDFELCHLPISSTTELVVNVINELSAKKELCGLIIQLPLPLTIDSHVVLNTIPERVDVDLLSDVSVEKFYSNNAKLTPPTPGAIMHILKSLKIDLTNKSILVLGQGELVGRPTAHILKQMGLMPQVADSSTENIMELLMQSDILISGVGKSGLVKGDQVKQDVIVIDAGTSETSGALSGDMDYDSVAPKAKLITPVPGGVGPVTVAKLLENVVIVAEQS